MLALKLILFILKQYTFQALAGHKNAVAGPIWPTSLDLNHVLYAAMFLTKVLIDS